MIFTEGNGGNGAKHLSPIPLVSKSVSLRYLCYLLCKGSSAFPWVLRTASTVAKAMADRQEDGIKKLLPKEGAGVDGNQPASVPVTFVEAVGRAVLLPARGYPAGGGARRQLPMARHPLVALVAPGPVASDPHVAG